MNTATEWPAFLTQRAAQAGTTVDGVRLHVWVEARIHFLGLTITALAQQVGYTRQAVADWCHPGRALIPASKYTLVANALVIPFSELAQRVGAERRARAAEAVELLPHDATPLHTPDASGRASA